MNMYKEWAFQLYPGLNFLDLLKAVQGYGSKGRVKTLLNELRDKEKLRYMVIHCNFYWYTDG